MYAPKPIAASGLPGFPSIFGMEKRYTKPKSTIPFSSNVNSRIFPAWTYNPLSLDVPEKGYLGNGGSNAF